MKKLLSVFLVIILVFSSVMTVWGASEDQVTDELYETGVTCDYFGLKDALVITFDSKYSQINKLPKIELDTRDHGTTVNVKMDVPDDHIIMEIYEYDGKRYPQIFIDTDICVFVMGVRIEAGAFADENGELSEKVNISKSQIEVKSNIENFGIACETEGYYKKDAEHSNAKEWFVTIGTPVKVEAHLDSDYAEAWRANATLTCTFNETVSEFTPGEMIPMEVGEYELELRLNDIFRSVRRFNAVSDANAYFFSLKNAGLRLLVSPVEFLFGFFVFFFMPGFGTMGGPVFMGDSVMSIPNFFKALFTGAEFVKLNF